MTIPSIALEHLERVKRDRLLERIFSSNENVKEAIDYCKDFLLNKGVKVNIPLEIKCH